jgi:hypothetical protein
MASTTSETTIKEKKKKNNSTLYEEVKFRLEAGDVGLQSVILKYLETKEENLTSNHRS